MGRFSRVIRTGLRMSMSRGVDISRCCRTVCSNRESWTKEGEVETPRLETKEMIAAGGTPRLFKATNV